MCTVAPAPIGTSLPFMFLYVLPVMTSSFCIIASSVLPSLYSLAIVTLDEGTLSGGLNVLVIINLTDILGKIELKI